MWERVDGSVTICGNGMFVLCAASALFVAYFQACPRNIQLEAKCALIFTLYSKCRGDFIKIYICILKLMHVRVYIMLLNCIPCIISELKQERERQISPCQKFHLLFEGFDARCYCRLDFHCFQFLILSSATDYPCI